MVFRLPAIHFVLVTQLASSDLSRRSDRVSYFLSEAAKIYRSDAGENATTKSDFVDGPEKERNHQILQNFTKAIWNVLKQYKQKLKVLIN